MKFKTIIAAACVAAASIASASAGVIIAPTSATANVPTRSGGWSLEATHNQSGLSSGYTSGVTDFDAYIASAPTHDNLGEQMWAGNNNTNQAEITYDLGGVFDLESFALWNRGDNIDSPQGINSFELIFSETADFSVSTTVSGLNAAEIGTLGATLPEVFGFSIIRAAFVKLNILSTYNTQFGIISFGEVAFEGAAVSDVPIPAALPLFLAGLGAFGFARRRKV